CIYKNENFNGQLNVKSFSDGIYFLKYSDDKSILSRKIIVRH
ncbi:MAG: T9SS type A sorting domain-containing protein, partial [Bacteroidia bacterium]|nr:T9SS type A sorting domain-containing protein [Bacteroidia bacterium]